eukprot:CAMPEP_0180001816 /NCGR_PEP_ID=MMETSP0984-20121128/10607_1 /TAXON_ID=483367 /ORGANISM="non described non described, Strain CCMP 2436" /LENGTH=193 /DNA_ID=CAMNT_0021921973 /DNA_START=783 /DNA_END=1361 /DNA_ORIENTATION=-
MRLRTPVMVHDPALPRASRAAPPSSSSASDRLCPLSRSNRDCLAILQALRLSEKLRRLRPALRNFLPVRVALAELVQRFYVALIAAFFEEPPRLGPVFRLGVVLAELEQLGQILPDCPTDHVALRSHIQPGSSRAQPVHSPCAARPQSTATATQTQRGRIPAACGRGAGRSAWPRPRGPVAAWFLAATAAAAA